MNKLTKDSLKAIIQALPNKSFTFEDLRTNVPAEYEVLKDLLFQLLDEPGHWFARYSTKRSNPFDWSGKRYEIAQRGSDLGCNLRRPIGWIFHRTEEPPVEYG